MGVFDCSNLSNRSLVMTHGGMGYAVEFHVERYYNFFQLSLR